MSQRILFLRLSIFDVVEHQKTELKKAARQLSRSDIEGNEEKLIAQFLADFGINVPTLRSAELYATEAEVDVDISRDPRRFIVDRSLPVYRRGTQITVHVPFDGDAALFDIRPSTFSSNPPYGDVVGSEIQLVYKVVDGDASIKAEYERTLSQIVQYLDWLRPAAEQLANELRNLTGSLISERKARFAAGSQAINSLGIPIRQVAPFVQSPRLQPSTLPSNTIRPPRRTQPNDGWDVFISHASEDKDAVAKPLAAALKAAGLRVWYDEFSLKLGDSLRISIDRGLSGSRYGIVILSRTFFDKHWPAQELNGLATREINGEKVILPIWHKVGFED